MNKAEVAQVLTLVAAFDRRTLGEADVEAWHLVLAEIDPQDAVHAVKDHYTERTDWLMPAHIVERARTLMNRRAGQARVAELAVQREAENTEYLRLVGTGQAEPPVDRDALKRRLQAGAVNGGRAVPRVDRRGDNTRREEARREIEAARRQQGGEAS